MPRSRRPSPAIDLLRSAGIATVIASGNNGWTDSISAPACISTAIAVGSTTKADAISSFSNMGPQVHLLAPGSSINSSVPGNQFGVASGTSMAAPHVAGAWAIMKQKKPAATVSGVLEAFQNTGTLVTDGRVPFNALLSGDLPAAGVARRRINVNQALSLLVGGPEEAVLVDFNGDGRDDLLLTIGRPAPGHSAAPARLVRSSPIEKAAGRPAGASKRPTSTMTA